MANVNRKSVLRQALADDTHDGPWIVSEAHSQVALEEVGDVTPPLVEEAPIEPQTLRDELAVGGRDGRVEELGGDVTGLGIEQEEDGGQKQHEQQEHLNQPFSDELQHAAFRPPDIDSRFRSRRPAGVR